MRQIPKFLFSNYVCWQPTQVIWAFFLFHNYPPDQWHQRTVYRDRLERKSTLPVCTSPREWCFVIWPYFNPLSLPLPFWPELLLFCCCCSQPLCVVRQKSWFLYSNLPPPPTTTTTNIIHRKVLLFTHAGYHPKKKHAEVDWPMVAMVAIGSAVAAGITMAFLRR